MIRFRPNVTPVSLSVRSEQCFESLDDLLLHLFHSWNSVLFYMGASRPLRPEEILVCDAHGDDPAGYKNVRRICVTRLADHVFAIPQCIGYCGE